MAVGDLAAYVSHWEAAVRAMAADEGLAETDVPLLSLVGVREGSAEYQLESPPTLAPGIDRLRRALRAEDWLGIPPAALTALHEANKVQRRAGWTIDFVDRGDHPGAPPRFSLPELIPVPPPPEMVRGTTSLIGTCVRVGGAEPKIDIRPLDPGSNIQHLKCTRDLAQQAAGLLYEVVVLEGEATWNSDTWCIESFKVKRIVPYRPEELPEAFTELADASGGSWDEVDAAEYVASARRG